MGALFVALDFPVAPILLGSVLGPMVEENFRRALLISRGDMMVFVQRPISGFVMAACALLIFTQLFLAARIYLRKKKSARLIASTTLSESR